MSMDEKFLQKQAALKNGGGLRCQLVGETGQGELSAFVLKYKDTLYAYENKCPHLGVELDWLPGEFFDDEQAFLVCSTHGALFHPQTGLCVSGPCAGKSLTQLEIIR